MMAVALLATFGTALALPAAAGAGGKAKVLDRLKVKRGAGAQSPRSALETAPRPGRMARVKNFFGRRLAGLKPINRKQHPFAPLKPGETRVFDIATSDGTSTTSIRLTQKVSDVRIQDGRLRAQVEQIWQSDGFSNSTFHVQDVSKDGMLMSTAEKLDEPPRLPIKVDGIGLPKKLKPGATWSNRMSWEAGGAHIDHRSQGRVLGKVRRAGPDGTLRDGVEIEIVSHSTTTIDGKPHRTTLTQRSIYLKGVGEVETVSRTQGQPGSMTRRLVGFTPGRDPG